MKSEITIDASVLPDEQPLQWRRIIVFLLIFLTLAIDGIDTQVTSYLAPTIAKDWGVSKAAMGILFSVGLAGSALGALTLGALGDTLGPRRIVIWLTAVIGVATLAMAYVHTVGQLAALRFVTGVGVGGSLPNLVALASQLAPRQRRATLVTMTGCGFPVGAALAGLLSTWLLASHSWRDVYLAAGAFPLLLLPLMLALLPDSIPCLLRRRNGQVGAATTLRRLYPGLPVDCQVGWGGVNARTTRLRLITIFQGRRAIVSMLLSGIFFLSLMNVYFLANWLPELLQRAHGTPSESLIATTVFNFGGVAGALLFGRFIDAFGYRRVLSIGFVCCAASMFVLANGQFDFQLLLVAAFTGGFLVLGGQGALNALPSLLYPSDQHSTATGWALGTGRLGSVLGPALAGMLLGAHWTNAQVLMLAALLPLGAATLLTVLTRFAPSSTDSSTTKTL